MKNKACYLTYYGLSESLLWSQAIPYLEGVAKETKTEFYIVSFEKASLINKKGVKEEIRQRLSLLGFHWICLPYHKSFYGKLYDIAAGNMVSLYLRAIKGVTIFHARGTMGYAFLLFIKKMKSIKILFDLRGIMAQEYVDAGFWNKTSLLYRSVKWMEINGLTRADAVCVLSNKIMRNLEQGDYYNEKVNPDKISVIYCAVDTKRFLPLPEAPGKESQNKQKRPVLLYLGSIGTWYLLEEMLSFFSVFKENFAFGHFLMVTHSSKDTINKKINAMGLNKSDFTIVYAKPDDVPRYISTADIGISFIKSCLSKTASCPTKLGEYLACGLPVVVNQGIGDVDDVVDKNKVGFIIDDFTKQSYQSVCNRIKNVIFDTDIKKRARSTALNTFSLESAVIRYSLLYKNYLVS